MSLWQNIFVQLLKNTSYETTAFIFVYSNSLNSWRRVMTTYQNFFTTNDFLDSGIINQYSMIVYYIFNYSAQTIWIIRIVFRYQKMIKYEYGIPLFGPNYLNSRIIQIIHPNTARKSVYVSLQLQLLFNRFTVTLASLFRPSL